MENAQLIQLLRTGQHNPALQVLYKGWPAVRNFIRKHGGNDDEARDVFQESLMILYKNAQKKDFTLTASVNTYLFSICRYIWKDELRKKNRMVSFQLPDVADEVNDFRHQEEETKWLDHVLAAIGEKCMTLLRMFYFKKMNMDEIAAELGYKNADAVKTRKYKCLEHARDLAAKAKSSLNEFS